MDSIPNFPPGFIFGAATASYQIEGGARQGNRGVSIWDRFSYAPGKTFQGHSGDVASDHYNRWQEDVALMAELGLHAYRFSIAWPRIVPDGSGPVNQIGLDFYDRLVDALLAHSIQPFVTLYHWDLPQNLQERGGWPKREIVQHYLHYTEAVVRRLGDRVKHWITFNEPWVFSYVGYAEGRHAPGLHDRNAYLQTAHHTLLAHGAAAQLIRSLGGEGTQVGITLNLNHRDPWQDTEEDRAAVRRMQGFVDDWFTDPLFKGHYPQHMLELLGSPHMKPGDLDDLPGSLDFLGINTYSRQVVRDDPNNSLIQASTVRPEGAKFTTMGWEVYPDCIYHLLKRVQRNYDPSAIYITENGAAFDDVLQDGQVDDPDRVEFLRDYLHATSGAVADGVPLKGYFAWSLLDNFEWGHGYNQRFGIVYVDYLTQKRVIKSSGRWYGQMIAAQPEGE